MNFDWSEDQLARYEEAKSLGVQLNTTVGDDRETFSRRAWEAIGASGILRFRHGKRAGTG